MHDTVIGFPCPFYSFVCLLYLYPISKNILFQNIIKFWSIRNEFVQFNNEYNSPN